MRTLIAYDCSGSTGGCGGYHRTTQEIVRKVLKSTSEDLVDVVLWDDKAVSSTLRQLKVINDAQQGRGGTQPVAVPDYIMKNPKLKEPFCLVFISDGIVDVHSVDRTERKMAELAPNRIAFASVHLIGSSVNMSVSCPFTRSCPHEVIVYSAEGVVKQNEGVVVTADDLDILGKVVKIQSMEDARQALPALERAITARMMGKTGDRELADALNAMRKRIVATAAQEQGKGETTKIFVDEVRANNVEAAIRTLAKINSEYFNPEFDSVSVEARINRLISACEGSLRNVFTITGVREVKASRAPLIADVPVESLEVSQAPLGGPSYACPITLDEETDAVILFAADQNGKHILQDVDAGIVDNCIECPLAALKVPTIINGLLDRVDQAMSLVAVQESITSGEPFVQNSPFSRRDIIGGLALGRHNDHANATDWTLAVALTGMPKRLGNPDLWYAVLFFAMDEVWDTRFARLGDEVRNQMRAQMVWRLKHRTSFASLVGLSHVVTTRMPLDVCCFFTLSSAASYENASIVPAVSDPLRAHAFHYEALVKLCDLSQLRLPSNVLEYSRRLRAALAMLNWVKRDLQKCRDSIRALYQRSEKLAGLGGKVDEAVIAREVMVPPTYIFLDGPATEQDANDAYNRLPEVYHGLTIDELFTLNTKVDPSLSAKEVALPFTFKPFTAKPSKHWKTQEDIQEFNVPICPATLRPYSRIKSTANPRTEITWEEAAMKRYGVSNTDDLLPTYRHFERFVLKYDAFPSNAATFLVFIYNREVVCAPPDRARTTLPVTSPEQVIQTLDDYAPFTRSLTVEEFKKRLAGSLQKQSRLDMEQGNVRM